MSIVTFSPAVRKGSHVLIALYGESGSGKTLSALYIARGLVGDAGKIAFLDTETGRGLTYADEAGGFHHGELTPPFTPERYIEAIKAAEAGGFDALIIDSASHEWEGLGGVLETADASGNQGLVKWAKPKARHKKFVQALLATRMHLIICLRAKEKLVQGKNPKTGKDEIVSAGMVSVQDKRFIYEMTVQVFMQNGDLRGVPIIEKCPRALLPAFPAGQQISIETGRRIAEWVQGGAPVDHAFEALKRAAEEAADEGTEALKAYWDGLGREERRQLQPHMENLKSIAAAVDGEAQVETHDDDAGDDAGDASDATAADVPGDEPERTSGHERAAAPPRDEAFWARESYEMKPPAAKSGRGYGWAEWSGWMTHAANDARTVEELAKLDTDNAHWSDSHKLANPRGHELLREHFAKRGAELGGEA